MKKLFSILAVATATQSVVSPAPAVLPRPQTQIVFADHEVPVFVVTEQKGQQAIVIDRSHLKSSVGR